MDAIITETFGNKLRLRASGILIKDNTILLVGHKRLGREELLWAPPGGGVQFGEELSLCLQREFREETCLEVEIGGLLFVNEYLEPPLHAVELFFEIKDYKGLLQVGVDPEMPETQQIIKEVKFVPFQEIKAQPSIYHSIFTEVDTLEELKNLKGYHKNINIP